MDGSEGVGDIELRHVRHGLGQGGIVLGLPLLKAGVLEEHHLAGLEGGGLGLGVGPHHVGGQNHVLPQELTQALRHGLHAQGIQGLLPLRLGEGGGVLALLGLLLHPLVKTGLGLAQMGAGDDGGAVLQQVLDGGQGGADALVVGNGAGGLILRNVEVAAEQDLLPLDIHVFHGFLVVVHGHFLLLFWMVGAQTPLKIRN